jgi:hypothetical protein
LIDCPDLWTHWSFCKTSITSSILVFPFIPVRVVSFQYWSIKRSAVAICAVYWSIDGLYLFTLCQITIVTQHQSDADVIFTCSKEVEISLVLFDIIVEIAPSPKESVTKSIESEHAFLKESATTEGVSQEVTVIVYVVQLIITERVPQLEAVQEKVSVFEK